MYLIYFLGSCFVLENLESSQDQYWISLLLFTSMSSSSSSSPGHFQESSSWPKVSSRARQQHVAGSCGGSLLLGSCRNSFGASWYWFWSNNYQKGSSCQLDQSGDTTIPLSAPGDTTIPLSAPKDTTIPLSAPGDTTDPISAHGDTTASSSTPEGRSPSRLPGSAIFFS